LALVERDLHAHKEDVAERVQSIQGMCRDTLDEVKKLREEFTTMVVELAIKRAGIRPLPPEKPDGLVIPKWLLVSLLGLLPGLGVGLMELIKLIIGATK
jgi:hypothetical protein